VLPSRASPRSPPCVAVAFLGPAIFTDVYAG
jgi:hypothetical protein